MSDAPAPLLNDAEVELMTVPGTGETEYAMIVRRRGGVTLLTNDIIGHVRHPHGLGAKVMSHLMRWGTSKPECLTR